MSDRGAGESAVRRAMQLVEQERAEIAHDLHDALLPLLFAAQAGVERLAEDAAAEQPGFSAAERRRRLEQVSGWLAEAQKTGRAILDRSYPPELEAHSWDEAAANLLAAQHPTATIRWRVAPETRQLTGESAVAAYRLTVEAVRNAIRHGQAGSIDVVADPRGEEIELLIRDNGRGFDPAQVPEGRYGLRSMRARAELLGGRLEIQSRPGGPTEVRAALPQSR